METTYFISNLLLSFLPKKAIIFIISFHIYISLIAQPATPISGVVNTYHRVIDIVPAKACIVVNNISGLIVNKRIMIVQMKGATINTSNSASFGDVTAMNEAGNYEIGVICTIKADSVFLFHNLLNTYTPTSGKVQLVQFAEYLSADVIDTVKAMPWDSTRGLGGVIALFAYNTITLNAPICADSNGYKGGSFFLSGGSCSDLSPATSYSYNAFPGSPPTPPTQNGANKGEGIATLATTQSGGRGAAANGGGGGNNHNNSGGGGGNLVAGGLGGGNSSTTGCTTAIPGIGGKGLNSSGGQKIFMGGGGGAGHNNNGAAIYSYGAKGGGIIFIWSSDLIGNNKSIVANGGNGGNSLSDGAGGGGAGGTIIMNINNYSGSLTIQANGGNGGNSNDGGNIRRCYGGGGGGSGGVIYFTGLTPVVVASVNAGTAGLETGSNILCAAPQAALPGTNGSTVPSYIFSRSTNPASYCSGFVLPIQLLAFNVIHVDQKAKLYWAVANPELAKMYVVEKKKDNNEWIAITTVNVNSLQQEYATFDNHPEQGNNLYRLKIIEKENTVIYSEIKRLYINYNDDDFTVYPNPAVAKITVTSRFIRTGLLRLSDITGKIILQQQILSNRTDINLPALPPGVYLIRLNEKIQKLIIR